MACYNCKYLDKNMKKDGNLCGCIYYCKKLDKYVNGAYDSCENHSLDYSRETYENNEIYNNGRHYNNSNTSLSSQVVILILLIIILVFSNILS